MNQKIFNLGLSVDTVSVYLICCSIADTDTTISTNKLSEMWNSTRASLLEGLKDLETRNILRRIISDGAGNIVYKLSDVKNWKLL
jgi:predicted transcriptional regulator